MERPGLPVGRPLGLAERLSWLAIPLFALVLLWPALGSDRILAPLDTLAAFEPWSSTRPEPPSNPLLLDQAIVTIPWLDRTARGLRQGELPLWNPDNYLGQPLHASASGALAFPLSFLYYLFPSFQTLEWIAFSKLLAAGLFLRAFLRARGLPGLPATLGGIAFAGSGFLIAWLGHPHTNVALLLPASLWCVERAARRADPKAVAWAALVVGGVALGGHLQTALHAGLAVALYAAFRLLPGGLGPSLRWRGLGALALGALLGLGLGALQLWPTLEYLGHSRAAQIFDQLDPTAEVGFGEAAVLLVDPNAHGRPDRGEYTGPQGDNLNYSELIGGYVGRVALVFALLGLFARGSSRDRWFFAGLALVAGAVAWQLPPFYELAREIGPLRQTKLLRLLLLVALGIAVLAAQGAAALQRALGGSRALWVGSLAVLAVGFELVSFGSGFQPAIEPDRALPETPLTAFLSTRVAEQPETRVLCLDNSTLIPSANLFFDIPLVTGYDSIEDDRVAELIALLTGDPRAELFLKEIRYFDRQLPLGSMLGIDCVVSGQQLPPPLELLHESEDGPLVYANPLALPRWFFARSVEFAPGREDRLAQLGAPDFDPWLALIESPPPAGFETYRGDGPRGRVREATGSGTQVAFDLEALAPSLLVWTEAWTPGWKAELDGHQVPIVRTNHALRGVWIPEGQHELVVRYAPSSFRLGAVLSGICALLILLAFLWPRKRPATGT